MADDIRTMHDSDRDDHGHEDPRLQEPGDQGMPSEFVDEPENLPGDDDVDPS